MKLYLPRATVLATKLDENNSDKVAGFSDNLAGKRRKLIHAAVQDIHSIIKDSDDEAKIATKCGLWHTLVNSVNNNETTALCKKSKVFSKDVIPDIVQSSVKSFDKSSKNVIRSVSVLYRGGILSKRKYSSVRSSVFDYDVVHKKRKRSEFREGCKVPALVPYKGLMEFIGEQNIGKLNNIPQALAEREIEKESKKISGKYLPSVPRYYIALEERSLQLLIYIFIYIESQLSSSLNLFSPGKRAFFIALGADGAPFGKANEVEKVASPDHNFLICGANCKEDHPSMIEYAKHLRSEVMSIESKTFNVKDQKVKFEIKLIPADMKWLSTFSGEINNAATYSRPFGNVKKDKLKVGGQSLGDGPEQRWQPGSYKFRTCCPKRCTV